jgi:chemosensory pili system protein ChpA (sensor histidine kinase/response regulator)
MQANENDIDLAPNDLGPLAWVLDELRKSLDSASAALRRFVRDTGLARGSDMASVDGGQLRIARQQLHQAVGALEMVGLGAPAQVLRSMEAAVQKFIERPELCNEVSAAKVERAGFALTEYLEGVLHGKPASSVALFPQYRETQELAGADRNHPADLWALEWRWHDPETPAVAAALNYDAALRSRMDQAVLRVVKSADAAAGRELAEISLALAAAQSDRQPRSFWKICAGYFEAVALGLLPADIYVKRAASRILLQYASLAKGEAGVSDRLAQDLVFFCSQAVPAQPADAPALAGVRLAWSLSRFTPVDYQVAQYGRFDPVLLSHARKRILAAKESWSALSGGDPNKIKGLADQFHLVSDSLVKLHPPSAPLAQSLNLAIEAVARSARAPGAELAMEVATAVLYLEAAFEELDPADAKLAARTARLAERLDKVRQGGKPEALEPWMEELYRRVSDRQTMGSVVGELRGTLSELEKLLDQFFRNVQDKGPLRDAPNHLSQMRGVLSVLGLDQAAQAVLRMRESVEEIMVTEIDEDQARATGTFDKLGNNLGALGFLIDMLNYQPALAKKLFVYDDSTGELRPLMGRTGHAALEPAAPREIAAPEPVAPAVAVPAQRPNVAAAAATPAPTAAPVPQNETDIEEDDLQDIFLEEAREVVQNGLAAIGSLTANPGDVSELTTLRRAFHTLKGSSRMVGLNEFGEAAWSLEQVLNTWLGDQKLASAELLGLAGESMRGFGRWVEDIAAGDDGAWKSNFFRVPADAFRTEARLVPLSLPGAVAADNVAAENIAETADFAVVEDTAAVADVTEIEITAVAADIAAAEPAQVELVDSLSSTQILTRDSEPVASEQPTFDLPAFDMTAFEVPAARPSAPQPAAASAAPATIAVDTSAFEFDMPAAGPAEEVIDFSAALNPEVQAPLSADELPADFEFDPAPVAEEERAPAQAAIEIDGIDFDSLSAVAGEPVATVEAATAQTPADLSFDLGDLESLEPSDFAPLSPAMSAPDDAAAIELDAAATESDPSDQVKVIGTLRIGIPLYNVYLNEADEWSRRLATEVAEWSLELNQRVPDSTVGLAHALAGSSATVGFNTLSDIARALESSLQQTQKLAYGTPQHGHAFIHASDEIRRLLHQFAAGFLKEPSAGIIEALQALAELDIPQRDDEPEDEPFSDFGALSGSAPAPVPVQAAQTVLQPQPEPVAMPVQAAQPVAIPVAAPVATAPAFRAPAVPTPRIVQPAPVLAQEDDEDEIDVADALDPDLFPIFEEEAIELMPQLGGALRQWAARPDNSGAREEALRALHTLKGSARLAGALRLGELAHRLESEIEYLGSEARSASNIEPLLNRFDRMQANLDALRESGGVSQESVAESAAPEIDEAPATSATAADLAGSKPAPATSRALLAAPVVSNLAPQRAAANHAVRVRSQLLDRLVNQAGEVMITRSRLENELRQLRGSLTDLTGNLDRLRAQLRDIELQAESQMQSRLAQAKDSAAGFDPLEFDRFTRVQELTRMMAESVNDVATVQRSIQRVVEATEDDLIAQARQTRELQRDLLRTRMVEFEGISERLYRVIRLASKETAKQVKLDITGGSIEMDRGVLDRMTPAFEHLLRNCVAHGIEDPATRVAAGKDPIGTILIGLSHEGNDVSVEFRDDGAGLNLPRIREKALQQGLISPDQALSEQEAANLIFLPGFSTAAQVTELSGRGIGMDVVRAEVNALGGRIETNTVPGRGTSFKLVLPLTTAVTQVVMIRSGNLSIGVPANLVETVRRAPAKEVQQSYNSGLYSLGADQLPFYWSGALLQSSQRSAEQAKTLPVVVFRSAAQRIAMHVDEVLGNQEVVVKNLGPQLARLPGLAGMTVLASGAVVLIYNPVALTAVYGEQARQLSADQAQPDMLGQVTVVSDNGAPLVPTVAAAPQIPLVLVVDDSITVRRVTQRLLVREGYRVSLAADGLQALERLAEERPTVVLSDIEMPRMDGFDLARNIRGDDRLKNLPIIMITSRIAQKHREHAKELGVDHYLGKPYSEEELLSLVRHYCKAAALA